MTKDTKEIFDRIAPIYDRFNDWLSLGQHRIWKRTAVKWSRARPGDTCLDVCCGSGDLAFLLAEQIAPTGRAIAVDFSPAQLAVARDRCDRARPPSPIEWLEADALQLPLADDFFDAATMGYGLRNVPDIPQCLQELHRVLKPGATVAILDFNRPAFPLRVFQQWYLDSLVVPIAREMGYQDEYAYITPSLERFPPGRQQEVLALRAGFARAIHYSIASGMMGVLVATKAE